MAFFARTPGSGPQVPFFQFEIYFDIWDVLTTGLPVPRHLIPKPVFITTDHRVLPDFYELTGGCIGVSDRARTCLEEVAAGQVDLIPLNIFDKRGHALPDPYYWLNINMRNNSLTIGKGDLFMVEEEVIEDDGSTRKVKSLRFDSSNPHVYLERSSLNFSR